MCVHERVLAVPCGGRGMAVQWPRNGRGATHCDQVGAAAPVLALVLVVAQLVCVVHGLLGVL
jgi:hypothetical protein